MARFIRKVLIAAGLLLALALLLDPVFTSIHRSGQGTKAQWLMRMHDQHYDAVVIGSSRAWWNIDMAMIDSACGSRSISLADNHFTPAEMLLAVRVFLHNGNTTRKLLVEIDHSSLTEDQEGFSSTVYDFVPFLEDSVVYGHLRPRSTEWAWLRYMPFWRYVKYDFKWGIEQATLSALGRRPVPFDSSGSYFSPNDRFYGKPGLPYAPTGHYVGEDLKALLALCRTAGIEVVPFTTPYYGLVIPEEARKAPARVMATQGLDLLDYSDSLNDVRCFNDNKHLNRLGGRRFTAMLVEAICD